MPRKYDHVSNYEEQILQLREEGYTQREIGEKLGFTREQIRSFFKRYHAKKRREEAGLLAKKKGRPPKGLEITESDKASSLRYKLKQQEKELKRLQMENELLRDFLYLSGKE